MIKSYFYFQLTCNYRKKLIFLKHQTNRPSLPSEFYELKNRFKMFQWE